MPDPTNPVPSSRFPTTRDGAPDPDRFQVIAHDIGGDAVVDAFPSRLEAEREAEALRREHAHDPLITFSVRNADYRRTATDVARIVLASPEDGTFTLDGQRVQEEDGFEVGGYDPHMPPPVVRPGQHTRRALARRVHALRREADKALHGSSPIRIGKWTDKGGRVHLDATRWIPGRALALSAGRLLKQEAIYDWATGECPEVDA